MVFYTVDSDVIPECKDFLVIGDNQDKIVSAFSYTFNVNSLGVAFRMESDFDDFKNKFAELVNIEKANLSTDTYNQCQEFLKTKLSKLTLDIALKLNELGFDLPCFANYWRGRSVVDFKDEVKGDSVSVDNIAVLRNGEAFDGEEVAIAIPTWELVFEWFRGKGLVGMISTNEVLNEGDPRYYASVDDIKEGGKLHDLGAVQTYEEARLTVVKKMMELL